VRLDRQASEVVLENIRSALVQRRPQVIQQLRALRETSGENPSLQQMMDWLHFDDADLLLKHGLPCRLLEQAGGEAVGDFQMDEKGLARGLRHVLVSDDHELLGKLLAALKGKDPSDAIGREQLTLGLAMVWGAHRPDGGEDAALKLLRTSAALRSDFMQVIEHRHAQLLTVKPQRFSDRSGALALHCQYTREQIMLALGKGRFDAPFSHREGVLHLPERNVDAFFVTINKSDKDFSPSTQYEDYAVTDRLFHWQSQSITTPDSPTGRRYINHRDVGYQPLLFVRESKDLQNGLTAPFRFLGPVDYVRHEGSKPMSIVWRLQHPLPAKNLRQYRLEAV
jgi:hypothetical protein